MSLFPGDDRRLRELILYIAARCEGWTGFRPALLERLLFQSDFLHFRLHGFPITGQTYRRGIHSPAPRAMGRVLRGMIRTGALRVDEHPVGDGLHVRRIPVALREPDLRIFDGQEIAVVEKALRFYGPGYGRFPEPSHGQSHRGNRAGIPERPDLLNLPWELAGPREEIPYHLALLADLAPGGPPHELPRETGAAGQSMESSNQPPLEPIRKDAPLMVAA